MRFYVVWSAIFQDHPAAQPLELPSALQFGNMYYKPETTVELKLNSGKTKPLVVAPSYFHDTGQLLRAVTEVRREYAKAHVT